jgi:P-type Cu2+ transporter
MTANPMSQTATVEFDPDRTSVHQLRRWVTDCGYHCVGQSVPRLICDPLVESQQLVGANRTTGVDQHPHTHPQGAAAIETTDDARPPAAANPAVPQADRDRGHAPATAMGHGGHAGHDGHGEGHGMSAMVVDMRNRFLVAAVLSAPILLWSPIGRQVLGFTVRAPFGLRDDVFSLLFSLPVIFYSSWIFFEGAWSALKARTLDMMVLVAAAIGAGWLYSVGVTLTGGGEVFYEAASVLAAFVLLGHWFEMRARGGANDAIRTLLDLAPSRAVVLRNGQPVEVPTAEVMVGDLLLVRPGAKIPVDGLVEDGASEVDE